jgi:hypothetical protein
MFTLHLPLVVKCGDESLATLKIDSEFVRYVLRICSGFKGVDYYVLTLYRACCVTETLHLAANVGICLYWFHVELYPLNFSVLQSP